jgi:glycine cleavage system H protein
MNFPENLLYTEDHEWLRTEGEFAFVGITAFAQKELGDIVFVEIETVGEKLKLRDVFGTVEAVKTVSDLFMPMSGEVVEVNPKIISNPELVNKDPYGDGWMIKIKVSNPEESSELLYSAEYQMKIGVAN